MVPLRIMRSRPSPGVRRSSRALSECPSPQVGDARSPPCQDGVVIDHFGINCTDYEKSKTFYDRVLGVLGFTRQMDVGWPSVTAVTASPISGSRITTAGAWDPTASPFAFQAADVDGVKGFYDAALAHGAESLHAPRLFPEYHPGYSAPLCGTPTATTSRPSSTEVRRRRPRARGAAPTIEHGGAPAPTIEHGGARRPSCRAPRRSRRLSAAQPRAAAAGPVARGVSEPPSTSSSTVRQTSQPAAFMAAGSRCRMVCSSVSRQPDPVAERRQRTRSSPQRWTSSRGGVDRQTTAPSTGSSPGFSRTRRAPGAVERPVRHDRRPAGQSFRVGQPRPHHLGSGGRTRVPSSKPKRRPGSAVSRPSSRLLLVDQIGQPVEAHRPLCGGTG